MVTFEKIKDCIICRKVTDNYDGIARKLDALGRPVVPKEYRQELEWKEGDFIGIYVYKDFLIFRKFVFFDFSNFFVSQKILIFLRFIKKKH